MLGNHEASLRGDDEALERDETIRSVLDSAGEGVASYFADYKKEEFLRWHAQVNSWEIDRYLTAF